MLNPPVLPLVPPLFLEISMTNRKLLIASGTGLTALVVVGALLIFVTPQDQAVDLQTASTAIQPEATGDYELGLNAAFAGDYATAFREFTVAAEEGLSLAQYNLGILYFMGQGVEQDFQQAFHWTEAAAQQGHINAQYNLGSLFLEGQGTRQNETLGIDWFKSAARAGHANAAYALSRMYQEGDPVTANLVEAHAWAALATENQHPEGAALQDELEQGLSAEELSQARRQFATWQIEPVPPLPPNR